MANVYKKVCYPHVLDHKPGFFLSWFLYRLFKRVQFDKNMTEDLKQMHRDGTVVYAIKYRGHLDYLLYHYRFRRGRLPYPKIAFDLNMVLFLPLSVLIKVVKYYLSYFFKHRCFPDPFETGFFRKAIQNKTTPLLFLVDPKGFSRHFIHSEKDRLHFLLEIQKDIDHPIYIVPQLILYSKTPEKEHSNLFDIFFGYKDNPGLVRKIALFFRHNRKAFIDFGRPLDLQSFLEAQPAERSLEQTAIDVRQMLVESIDNQKRVVLGPVMKSRQQLKEEVLKDSEITQIIERMGQKSGKQLRQARKKAGAYFDEIAADYNSAFVQFVRFFLKYLWKKIFDGIDVDSDGLALVRDRARRGSIIYVPSHKSHIDYLVLNDVIYQHHMHIPRIAAGTNLAFWPLGHIFRKCGAFFIRRTFKFKGTRLYFKVFSRYVKSLLKEGHPLQFFIEGGRSRSGKLILPKTGFLSILLQAYQDGFCEDLIFVPTSIGYDRIPEEKSYLKEAEGGTKQQETMRQFFKARHFLRRKYGKIYIRFGTPLSFREYQAQRREKDDKISQELALHIIRSINKVAMATPLSLVASAILSKHRGGFHLSELVSTVETIMEFLERYQIPTVPTQKEFDKLVRETIPLLITWKIVSRLEEVNGEATFYYVDEDKKQELEYYKNNTIHWFVSHAFVALSLLRGTEEEKTIEAIKGDYGFMKRLFMKEFVYEQKNDDEGIIDNVVDYFLDVSFIVYGNTNDNYRVTRLGFDKLPIWAGLIKTYLESYWIATRSLVLFEIGKKKRGDLLKDMHNRGLQYHKLGLIDHIEAISQLNFQNAIKSIDQNIGHDDEQSRENLSQVSNRLDALTHYRT